MDIREYSSGGKHHRFGITKHGNRYLRTAVSEKISAILIEEYLRSRAERAKLDALKTILDKVPDREPSPVISFKGSCNKSIRLL